ncbi:MAG: class I SAM-dependent DNA methyltransferase [Aquabacterium sp.]
MLDHQQKEELSHAMWHVLEASRGAADPSDVRDCALALLLLKYMSDCRRSDRHTTAAPAAECGWFMPDGADFYALLADQHKAGNAQRIDRALHAIEEANHFLEGVSQQLRFDFTAWGNAEQKDRALAHLLSSFAVNTLDFRSWGDSAPEAVAYACDTLIKQTATAIGKKGGEFFTPPELSQLIARLMQAEPGESISDPFCGSGTLLMTCGQLAQQKSGHQGSCSLYGQEKNGRTWALAHINMVLHGENQAQLAWGDTLRDPKFLAKDDGRTLQTFDVVVSCPPFSLREWGHEDALHDPWRRYRRGVPPRASGDYAFISHMVETLKARTGRMAVVVSLGVLFRGGAEQQIREKLLQENLVDAVIALPPKMLPHTAIPVALLVLRKGKADDHVLFIDASLGYQHGKLQNALREDDLARIESAYQRREDFPKYSRRVSLVEIVSNGHNLNVARYIDATDDEETLDLGTLRAERDQIRAELAHLEARMAELIMEVE